MKAGCGGSGCTSVDRETVFGELRSIAAWMESIFGGSHSRIGNTWQAPRKPGTAQCFRSQTERAGRRNGLKPERGCCDACETPGMGQAPSERARARYVMQRVERGKGGLKPLAGKCYNGAKGHNGQEDTLAKSRGLGAYCPARGC